MIGHNSLVKLVLIDFTIYLVNQCVHHAYNSRNFHKKPIQFVERLKNEKYNISRISEFIFDIYQTAREH